MSEANSRRCIYVVLLLCASLCLGQSDSVPSLGAATKQDPSKVTDKNGLLNPTEEVLTFKKRVNLVVVPVVVRDKEGKAVGSLKREDFRLFDDGKVQSISTFNIETNGPAGERTRQGSVLDNPPVDKVAGPSPSHFFAYLFDDVHLHTGDLMQVRVAAKKHLESGMGPNDRAAVFTTSGDVTLGFTDDKAQLTQSMERMKPGLVGGGTKCPYMNYYLAKKVVSESESGSVSPAWDGATDDTWNCFFSRAKNLEDKARELALNAARQEMQSGNANTRRALLAIETAVRRLAAMPGARTLVLVSPGFQIDDDHVEQNSAITLANERNIVINALDARGLYTGINSADMGEAASTLMARQLEEPINLQGLWLQTNVMVELAAGTGGKFFHDNNDLFGGFNQLATPPEYVYMLAFRPEILKQGGRYHRLKVAVAKNRGWTIQARGGYYESAGAGDPEKMLSEELGKALFSREEMRTMPIVLKTGYLKKDGSSRELSVTTHLEISGIHFRKVDNKNVDDLTLVCGLFDLNGSYLQGKKQEISLRLEEDVLQQLTEGMNVKTTFDVEPGAYQIRVVLRDSGDQLLSAVNGSGFIP